MRCSPKFLKITKNQLGSFFRFQGRLRLSMLVPMEKSSALVAVSNKYV